MRVFRLSIFASVVFVSFETVLLFILLRLFDRCPYSSGTENYASKIARHFSQPRFVAEGDIVPVPISFVPSILDGCGNIPADVMDDVDDELCAEGMIICSDSKLFVFWHRTAQSVGCNPLVTV